jgi:RHS repeat-associated protein
VILVLSCASAYAGVITFEDLPDAYFFNAGNQNIGNFYPNITFAPNVTSLSVSRFGGYSSDAFPPHSGDVVIWDAADPTITISFDSPIQSFGVWYTSFDPLTLQAFDAGNNLLGTTLGDPNTDGTIGTSSFVLLADPGIASVDITSSPGLFTLDDLTLQSSPEPRTSVLIASVCICLFLFRRFHLAASHSARSYAPKVHSETTSSMRPSGTLLQVLLPSPVRVKASKALGFLLSRSLLVLLLLSSSSRSMAEHAITVAGMIPVGPKPQQAVITPNGAEIYVSHSSVDCSSGCGVSVINTQTNTVTEIPLTGINPNGNLVMSPDGQKVYIGDGNFFAIVDTSTKAVTTACALPIQSFCDSFQNNQYLLGLLDMTITPDGRTIFFTGRYALQSFSKSSYSNVSIDGPICSNGVAADQGVTMSPNGLVFYATYQCSAHGGTPGHDVIGVYSLPSNTFQRAITGLPNVGQPGLRVSPNGAQIWASGLDACQALSYDHRGCPTTPGVPEAVVNVISTANYALRASLGFPLPFTSSISFSPDSSSAWLGGNTLKIVDTNTLATIAALPIPASGSVAFTPDGAWAYAHLPSQNAVALLSVGSSLPLVSTYFGPSGTTTNRSASFAEPVNTASGNYYATHTDLVARGRGLPFQLTRSYNSLDPYISPVGAGWTHSYNWFLSEDPITGYVTVKEGIGATIQFAPVGGGSYAPTIPGLFDVLKKNVDSSFTLTRKSQLQLKFSSAGRLLSITDRNGNTQMLSYNTAGNLSMVTDTVGRLFAFSSDMSGRIVSITDPIGRVVRYTYDASGNLATFQDALGSSTRYTYDSNHHLISGTDARGIVYVQNTYDSQGRVVNQKNGNGLSTTFMYSTPSAGTTTITDPLGNATEHVYDGQLRIIKIINAQAGATSFTYDSNNNRTSVTQANGKTVKFTYDGSGNITSVTDPIGAIASFTFDAFGDILTATNPADKTTSFAYDGFRNLVAIQDPLGNTTSFTYDGFGEVTSRVNAAGNKTTLIYDVNGNVRKLTNGAGNTTTITYDAVGRAVSFTDGNAHSVTVSYDALNRPIKMADGLGNQSQYAYDAVGSLLKVVDTNGNATAYQYDNVGNLVAVTDALANNTTYGYDGNNNVTSFKNANGKTSTYIYDSLNRRVTLTGPLGLSQSYIYDSVGNVMSMADPNGKTSTFTYDAVNRLLARTYADGNVISYSYDANGNRVSMTDSHGITAYTYDVLNRVTAVNQASGGIVKYSYDGVGRRTSLTYPDGHIVTYVYDGAGRLSQVGDWLGRKTLYTYDAAGNRLSVTLGNGVTSKFAYDNANRLLSIVNRSSDKVVTTFTYAIDAVGNRQQVTDAAGGLTRYDYDVLNRLTSWTAPSGQKTLYSYDATGNRTSVVSSAGTTLYTYDADGRLLTAGTTSFTYDNNGNRVTKSTGTTTVSYIFDALNRLTAVSGGGIAAHYQYDGDGNRITQQVGASSYEYSLDVVRRNAIVLNENGPDGNIDFQHGLTMLCGSSSGLEQFYQQDGVGSTTDVIDATGAVRANYTYDPWGKLLSPLDPLGAKDKFKFAGEALDPQTGLYYLRSRYYDPAVGVFISRDRLSGVAGAPLTTNRYSYALNNPTNLTDPSGLAAEAPSGDVLSNSLARRSLFFGGFSGGCSGGGGALAGVGKTSARMLMWMVAL